MQPDLNRYDDDPEDYSEDEADELADEESFELSAEEEAELSQINDPHIRKHLRGIRHGIESRKKERAAAEHRAREEAEKPFVLPIMDEEEIAAMTDPTAREEKRRKKIAFYTQFPNAYDHYMERSRALEAERKKPVLLEPWANDRRAAPNAVFRSALFPALNNKKRKFIKEYKVYSVGGLDVTFTGEQFDQTDLDVYLEILNLAKAVPLGQPVRFSAYSLLKALGRCTGKTDHKWLHSVLVRLCGGVVEVTDHKARYFGQLLFGGVRDEITNDYEITINPNFAKLFGFGLWSSIDLEQRRALERNSTAKALHAYYSTHTAPSLHLYDTLAQLAGLDGRNKTAVKNSLIRAHEELRRVGFLVSYDTKPNGIEVVIKMTEGQQQHLVRKVAKAPKPRKTP
jgi:hypothetical protein